MLWCALFITYPSEGWLCMLFLNVIIFNVAKNSIGCHLGSCGLILFGLWCVGGIPDSVGLLKQSLFLGWLNESPFQI